MQDPFDRYRDQLQFLIATEANRFSLHPENPDPLALDLLRKCRTRSLRGFRFWTAEEILGCNLASEMSRGSLHCPTDYAAQSYFAQDCRQRFRTIFAEPDGNCFFK